MPFEPPEPTYGWVRPRWDKPLIAVVLGPAETYWVHWVSAPSTGRSIAARCRSRDPGGHICSLCLSGANPARARYVIPVEPIGPPAQGQPITTCGTLRLIELPATSYPDLSRIHAAGWYGVVCRLVKTGQHATAPIVITRLQVTADVPPEHRRDIATIAATLGLRELQALGICTIAGGPEPGPESPAWPAPIPDLLPGPNPNLCG